jgi:hypothetical protein
MFRDMVHKTDVIEYMSGMVQPDYECWAKGSWQLTLFPFGVATLATYTFALPMVALWWLRKNRTAVKTDQILRAQGMGDDRLSNPRFYDFRMMWQKLYYHYLPGKWYWEFVIMTRKMFIAGTTLAFRDVPSYQLAIALLVLFTAYVLHVKNRPYMSHTTINSVVELHKKKIMTDPLHAKIDADIREAIRKNYRKRTVINPFDRTGLKKNSEKAAMAVIMHAFDANTVEAVLLACCVLISLAGIMIDSKRFSGDNMQIPRVQHEYLAISVACVALIVMSFIYFIFVFCMELSLVMCPGRAASCLQTCTKKKLPQRKGQELAAATHAGRASKTGSDLAYNPMLLKQAALASNGPQVSSDGVLSAKDLMNLPSASGATWAAIQSSYAALQQQVEDLRNELRDAKAAAERAPTAALTAANSFQGSRLKSRMEFRPTQSKEKAGEEGGSASSSTPHHKDSSRKVAMRMSLKPHSRPSVPSSGLSTSAVTNPLFADPTDETESARLT